MHLLRTIPGSGFVEDTEGVIRIDQNPADLVILSSADTTLSLLASVVSMLPQGFPSIRLANITFLQKPASIDFYVDDVLKHARAVVIDQLGGETYWSYGIEQAVSVAKRYNQKLAMFSGDLNEDLNLIEKSTISPILCYTWWRYIREGGSKNADSFLRSVAYHVFGFGKEPPAPYKFPAAVLYYPGKRCPVTVNNWLLRWQKNAPIVAILFYKAHLQASNTEVFDSLIDALEREGMNPLPIAITSLKDAVSRKIIMNYCRNYSVSLILNTTSFSSVSINDPVNYHFRESISDKSFLYVDSNSSKLSACDVKQEQIGGDAPIFQVILSSSNRATWVVDNQGLHARDIAMHIALPEIDGRIITRAVSFKGLSYRCTHTEVDVVRYQPEADRITFVAKLAQRWCRLRTLTNMNKRVALILANYPKSEGRIGNGVGLDTPESTISVLTMLKDAGYQITDLPEDGDALIARLVEGVTNDQAVHAIRPAFQSYSLTDYNARFLILPDSIRHTINKCWGPPENDPTLRQNRFTIAGWRSGNVFVGIQPSRSRCKNDYANYHNTDLVPPHSYLAFYFWIRDIFAADAVVHLGKHGNLEWLPGKSLALSNMCWPDLTLGPMPNLYPFIVNDPGEGSQAKRRIQAVIIDHLMPPLTRAENYGPLQDLERQVDEYYEAMMVDERRAKLLRKTILKMIKECCLHDELNIALPRDINDEDKLLTRVDAWLCELKEIQIRDGLHVFGRSPCGCQRRDTLLALSRFPVGNGQRELNGLLGALSCDLQLGDDFNPLSADWAKPWHGPRPDILQAVSNSMWRHAGDTRERLELLASEWITRLCNKVDKISNQKFRITDPVQSFVQTLISSDSSKLDSISKSNLSSEHWPNTNRVLSRIEKDILPRLDSCGEEELRHLQRGLSGLFVPPGPSGSPSRGRPDVLPTGRNFYSIDTRAVPTQAAWTLGLKSANQLIERHLQEQGDYPKAVGISVWGTSTMRTGGDDIAQALALLGVKPKWAHGSYRVIDFEILPIEIFDRPRIDVTLRISGFFRDAFQNLIHLFSSAVQAISVLDEPIYLNPIRWRIEREQAEWIARGIPTNEAKQRARWRVFGSQPGHYGTGLQEIIDTQHWRTDSDLVDAYCFSSSYAYAQNITGDAAPDIFSSRLAQIDVVIQNQDNREHDILDSNDYYQFQGGMTLAVRYFSGRQPSLYHGDHTNPDVPVIRTLREEIARVIRSRVVNPKWINGVKRHAYKGAAEIAATVDYLYGYDATTRILADHQYALVADAYLFDNDTREFLEKHNPCALHGICERFVEAIQRGLWQKPGNYQERIKMIWLESEQRYES
ncbi:MAG: cobaltochelatase subunit CobN [Burkholderia sp.]|nr:cobaltochelatase subunit CobN [Burkholderia sp.]